MFLPSSGIESNPQDRVKSDRYALRVNLGGSFCTSHCFLLSRARLVLQDFS